MNKTLTKKILRNAAIKRTAMYQAITSSILFAAFSIIFVIKINDRLAIENILFALALASGLFLFIFIINILGKGRIAKFITKQESALRVSFEDDMSKEGVIYKGFRVYEYTSKNWFIYGGDAVHSNYIKSVDGLARDMKTNSYAIKIEGTCVNGKRFKIMTDDSGFEEFVVWYAKVNPADPVWKRQIKYRPGLEGRNLPEGWMAPKKEKKGRGV